VCADARAPRWRARPVTLDCGDRFTLTVAAVEATVLRPPLLTRFNRRLTTGSHRCCQNQRNGAPPHDL
jgi:hypothetical protein